MACFCAKCHLFMKTANKPFDDKGVVILTRKGKIYGYRRGDLLECPTCKMQVITNFGSPVEDEDVAEEMFETGKYLLQEA